MFFFDNTMLILIPAILLTLYAQYRVKSSYEKYAKIPAAIQLSGKEVIDHLLRNNGLKTVSIEMIPGKLTDHYDSKRKILRLSREVFYGQTVASHAIAAHEFGHVIQDSTKYFPLVLRSYLVPISNIGSRMAVPLFLIGFIFSLPGLMEIGIIAFSLVVLFQIITLPVEFDASKKALKMLRACNMVDEKDIIPVRKVLNAAALTYIAATSVAVMQLLRLIVLRNRRG